MTILNPPLLPTVEDLWRAYESAQRHYEKDLDLFATRMNFFLTVDTALAALVASEHAPRINLALIGIAVSVAWFLVWLGSYWWITKWRAELFRLSGELHALTGVQPAPLRLLAPVRGWSRLILLGRPSGVMLALPLVYVGFWVYLSQLPPPP